MRQPDSSLKDGQIEYHADRSEEIDWRVESIARMLTLANEKEIKIIYQFVLHLVRGR